MLSPWRKNWTRRAGLLLILRGLMLLFIEYLTNWWFKADCWKNESNCQSGEEDGVAEEVKIRYLFVFVTMWGRFWWTESPLKSAQKSIRESRSTQKSALESKCTLESAQQSAQTSSTAQTRAQKIALKSKSLKRVLKRVRYSIKCSGEWVNQKNKPLKRVRYS